MKPSILSLIVLCITAVGCQHVTEPPVATQPVGIASSPLGAKVYVDGIEKGVTPITVVLEKNRDHLISIVKDGYKPLFVPIGHRVDETRISLEAVRSGLSYARYSKNFSEGLDSAMDVYDYNDKTGQYNILSPSCVTVTLEPVPENEQLPVASR